MLQADLTDEHVTLKGHSFQRNDLFQNLIKGIWSEVIPFFRFLGILPPTWLDRNNR